MSFRHCVLSGFSLTFRWHLLRKALSFYFEKFVFTRRYWQSFQHFISHNYLFKIKSTLIFRSTTIGNFQIARPAINVLVVCVTKIVIIQFDIVELSPHDTPHWWRPRYKRQIMQPHVAFLEDVQRHITSIKTTDLPLLLLISSLWLKLLHTSY